MVMTTSRCSQEGGGRAGAGIQACGTRVCEIKHCNGAR
jgi:hypothetical protein